MPIIPLDELKEDKTIKTKLLGHALEFKTTWGLFCPEEIDEGTRMLLEAVGQLETSAPSLDPTSILDIGCGYGPIGITLAKHFQNSYVDMIDKDFVAVDYAHKNSFLNNTDKTAKSFLSNGFSHIQKNKIYDLIVSNLPAKVNKEFFWILFGEAYEHLNEGGVFAVVAIGQLEPMLKKSFEAVFGNSEVVKKNKLYSVVVTKKI
jgi:16S rRNA (guanine1207-N2)-methyltransferase